MSSHHTTGDVVKHYVMEENAVKRKEEAREARKLAGLALRDAMRKQGLAVQRELRWLLISEFGWGMMWLLALTLALTTAIKVLE